MFAYLSFYQSDFSRADTVIYLSFYVHNLFDRWLVFNKYCWICEWIPIQVLQCHKICLSKVQILQHWQINWWFHLFRRKILKLFSMEYEALANCPKWSLNIIFIWLLACYHLAGLNFLQSLKYFMPFNGSGFIHVLFTLPKMTFLSFSACLICIRTWNITFYVKPSQISPVYFLL